MAVTREHPVVVVGAGLSGLACAWGLRQSGVEVRVLEATDGVGGRARTDFVDGFTLDRGFQILLTAYPAVQRLLDLDALDLGLFAPGSLVRYAGTFHRLADPWRDPMKALPAVASPIGGLLDKIRVGRLSSA